MSFLCAPMMSSSYAPPMFNLAKDAISELVGSDGRLIKTDEEIDYVLEIDRNSWTSRSISRPQRPSNNSDPRAGSQRSQKASE
jgi:hypothetical protein